MKDYLIEFFQFNVAANRKVAEAINRLPDNAEAARLFSHLIHAQNKWFNRIKPEIDDASIPWSGETFPAAELEARFNESIDKWMKYLNALDIDGLQSDVQFSRPVDGRKYAAKVIDIILQINYHSIHHRAQILKLMSAQGVKPPATDYILSKLRPAQ